MNAKLFWGIVAVIAIAALLLGSEAQRERLTDKALIGAAFGLLLAVVIGGIRLWKQHRRGHRPPGP